MSDQNRLSSTYSVRGTSQTNYKQIKKKNWRPKDSEGWCNIVCEYEKVENRKTKMKIILFSIIFNIFIYKRNTVLVRSDFWVVSWEIFCSTLSKLSTFSLNCKS